MSTLNPNDFGRCPRCGTKCQISVPEGTATSDAPIDLAVDVMKHCRNCGYTGSLSTEEQTLMLNRAAELDERNGGRQ